MKLIDFSSSCKKDESREKSYSFCGSPEYMSPEMVESKGHSFSVDWWSLGILMYELLYGVTPFQDNNTDKMYELILNAELKFRDNSVDISDECKDFIKSLLIKNPNLRLGSSKGFEEIKEHSFFNSLNFEGILNYDVVAPFIPDIKNNFDLSYFPEDVTNEDFSDSLIGIESLKRIEENKSAFEKLTLNS